MACSVIRASRSRRSGLRFGTLVLAVLVVAGASAEEPAGFSGESAMTHLEAVAALGPRPSGSDGMTRQREMLLRHFQAAGGTVRRQPFQIRDRRSGRVVPMENIVVEWHPERPERVLLAAHYDTRPFPDRDPVEPQGTFVGANDGASGVALLMELARSMGSIDGTVGVDFVLFDAEEYVVAPRDPYCLGSTFFAREHAAGRIPGGGKHRYRCGVVLDMVADRDLEIWQEGHSASWPDTQPIVDSIWDVAARRGAREFVPRPRHTVEDDHVPLRMIARIPTCDIIDFDYPQWHTTQDTARSCSAESLAVVGGVILQWLRELR